VSAQSSVPAGVHRYVEQLMGMPVSLALRGRHAGTPEGEAAWRAVVAELREVDRVFSTYRDDSIIRRLDRGELIEAACPPEVAEVLTLGRQAEQESGGAFSILLPSSDGRSRLDPSGVVKGWAVQRASRLLRRLDDTDFCLSAGGDLVCHTADPERPDWKIGIENPRHPQSLIAVVPVRSGAVATSGTAHRGSHLVDPRTGATPAGVASVTVIADSLTWADIDATAAYVLARAADSAPGGRPPGPPAAAPTALEGQASGEAPLPRLGAATAWLQSRPIRSALVVWADGTTTRVVGRLGLPTTVTCGLGIQTSGLRPRFTDSGTFRPLSNAHVDTKG
jgi:FAD:protein FMN transferase